MSASSAAAAGGTIRSLVPARILNDVSMTSRTTRSAATLATERVMNGLAKASASNTSSAIRSDKSSR